MRRREFITLAGSAAAWPLAARGQQPTIPIIGVLRNRLATAGELSASIAHEVRQPLTAISSSVEAGLLWLKRPKPNLKEVRKSLESVVEEIHHADEVLEGVRAMFRHEATARSKVNLNELVEQVISVAARPIKSNNVTVETNLTHDVSPLVMADPVQLQQVILNLVMNAVESMGHSSDKVRVLRLRTERGLAGTIVVGVADSGPPVDSGVIEKMFQPFHDEIERYGNGTFNL
jgi:C4-dicarboxylate-specific signal transduction histidine kinase